jgi:hypothetical protein
MNLLIIITTSILAYLYIYAFTSFMLIIFEGKQSDSYDKQVSTTLLLLSSVVFIYAMYNNCYFIVIDYIAFCIIDYYAGKLHCLLSKQDFNADYKISSLSLAVFIVSMNYMLLHLGITTDSMFISQF